MINIMKAIKVKHRHLMNTSRRFGIQVHEHSDLNNDGPHFRVYYRLVRGLTQDSDLKDDDIFEAVIKIYSDLEEGSPSYMTVIIRIESKNTDDIRSSVMVLRQEGVFRKSFTVTSEDYNFLGLLLDKVLDSRFINEKESVYTYLHFRRIIGFIEEECGSEVSFNKWIK